MRRALGVILLLVVGSVYADPVTWTLGGVKFNDGGVAFGTFDYDATTNEYSNINIQTAGGTQAPFADCIDSDYNDYDGIQTPSSATTATFIQYSICDSPYQSALILTFSDPLTGTGGTKTLLIASNASIEQEGFTLTYRNVLAGGSVATLPTPAAVVDWSMVEITPSTTPKTFENAFGNPLIKLTALEAAGATATFGVDPVVGNYVQFPAGVSVLLTETDWINTGAPAPLGFIEGTGAHFTIGGWARFDVAGGHILSIGDGFSGVNQYITITNDASNNRLLARVRGSNQPTTFTEVASANDSIVVGEWFHYALVRDYGNTLTLYVNGQPSGSANDATTAIDFSSNGYVVLGNTGTRRNDVGYMNVGNVVEGAFYVHPAGGMQGAVGETFIWDALLNHSEVFQNYIETADIAAPFGAVLPIENPSSNAGDEFGRSVSVSGDRVLVGAWTDDTTGNDSGRAYLFDATTGALTQTFENPSPNARDFFGRSVSVSGNRVLAGAFGDSTTGTHSGRAYLFDAMTGANISPCVPPAVAPDCGFENPSPDIDDNFGYPVSVSGNRVLAGASTDNTTGTFSGRAYLFDAMTGANISPCVPPAVAPDCGFENPSPDDYDRFGYSVSVSGNRVLVGAWGRAYLFNATTGVLTQTFERPSSNTGAYFGRSVSVSGNRVLVGAWGSSSGQAYLFDATTGALTQTFENPSPNSGDDFGHSVSVSGDRVLVGASTDDTTGTFSGRAYLFDATTGALTQTFENPSPNAGDYFGYSVSVSGDRVLVGAYRDDTTGTDSGRAYLFFDGIAANIGVAGDDLVDGDIHTNHDGWDPNPSTPAHLPDDPIQVTVFGAADLEPTNIDASTLRFGPARTGINPASSPIYSVDYSDPPDAVLDARFEFLTSESGIGCGYSEASLVGEMTITGERFAGTETITTDCNARCH